MERATIMIDNIAELNEVIEKNAQLVIYGAGFYARFLVEYIISIKCLHKIQRILVTCAENNPESIYGIPVMQVNAANDKQMLIIIAMMEKNHLELVDWLHQLGFVNLMPMSDSFEEMIYNKELPRVYTRYVSPYIEIANQMFYRDSGRVADEMRKLNSGELCIPRLVVCLGTKCNLRCKECNNLMPHYGRKNKKKAHDLDVEKIFCSIERIIEMTNSILRLELIGGEPFVSKNLLPLLEYCVNQSTIEQIEITTNGMVVPVERKLISLLTNDKVLVRISDYEDYTDNSPIIALCQNEGIKYDVLKFESWISSGGIDKRGKGIYELKDQFQQCPSGYFCKTLFEDKVFHCARAASLFDLGYMPENDYLIVDKELSTTVLKDFLLTDYAIACDYCDRYAKDNIYTIPGEQV